ncbi:unnamed protein product [Hymenolepis diminuta]|uniref:Uncharacterized protein n=1 Tax=Hymenolepis diminuta TaxID=6216 RepID=A0A3P7BBI2_HYMDI|nr:unnamed protein product [Hymenolepis diminuta]
MRRRDVLFLNVIPRRRNVRIGVPSWVNSAVGSSPPVPLLQIQHPERNGREKPAHRQQEIGPDFSMEDVARHRHLQDVVVMAIGHRLHVWPQYRLDVQCHHLRDVVDTSFRVDECVWEIPGSEFETSHALTLTFLCS